MTSSIRFDRLGLQAQILRPPKPMRRTHFHSEVELNHVVRGSVTYLYQGRLRRLEAGQWAMFLGTVPHSLLRAEPDSEMTWLTLPLAWIMSWRLPAPAMRRLLGGGVVAGSPTARKPIRHRRVGARVERIECPARPTPDAGI